MDFKLLFSTFLLVFLAELGDKTQLTAMAASASSKSTLSVFIGASCALVLSTLVAVIVGSTLQKYIPINVIKICAAVLFLIFGGYLLISTITERGKMAAEQDMVKPDFIGKLVVESALAFEKAAAADYRALTKHTDSKSLQNLLLHLAAEEEEHLMNLKGLVENTKPDTWQEEKKEEVEAQQFSLTETDKSLVDIALKNEKNTVIFYEALAEKSLIPSVRSALRNLAKEEMTHIAHLEEFKEKGTFTA